MQMHLQIYNKNYLNLFFSLKPSDLKKTDTRVITEKKKIEEFQSLGYCEREREKKKPLKLNT